MPFEGVFSKVQKRARFRGQTKVYFQAVIEAIVFNAKRLIACEIETVPILT